MKCLFAGAALALAAGLASATPDQRATPRPEVRVGPYRLLVERVNQQQNVQTLFLTDPHTGQAKTPAPGDPSPSKSGRCTAHVSMKVLAATPEAGLALELFSVQSATVSVGGREVECQHYGGPLDNKGDAVLRAYLYATNLALGATEFRSIDGEITAYERARMVPALIPLQSVPSAREVEGITLTVTRCSQNGSGASVRLLARAPAHSQLLPGAADSTYGVQLLGTAGTPAEGDGGSLGTTTTGETEFELNYTGLKGEPAELRTELLLRSGARKSYPFRLEHVPLPASRPGR